MKLRRYLYGVVGAAILLSGLLGFTAGLQESRTLLPDPTQALTSTVSDLQKMADVQHREALQAFGRAVSLQAESRKFKELFGPRAKELSMTELRWLLEQRDQKFKPVTADELNETKAHFLPEFREVEK